ncbi:MAG TPA: glutamine synthetase family protein [Chloroflexota bacterium]|nr:glutamine synthetase family protein [Chloroflexota bacterium]
MLERTALQGLIERGEIDTVILAFPDQQGRLLGKRFTARHFVAHVAEEGMHACTYLLTVDMEMEPLPGYRLANWEDGYGDFHVAPDWSTARRLPWLEATALLLGDLYHQDGRPVEEAPRRVLRRQVERAAALGFRPRMGSEVECYLYRESFASAGARGFRNLQAFGTYVEDYHLLQGTREEPLLRAIRNQMEGAGVAVEGTKGEWGRGQVELNLAYTDALEMADRHTILKQGAKEIAEQQGAAITFMAKPDAGAAGSSCHVHASLWDETGQHNRFRRGGDGGGDTPAAGDPDLFQHYLAGQLALARELSLCYAPTVNSYKRYQSMSWAPTAVTWGEDNRTCGFRIVGRGRGLRVENRLPGADANPYLAFAAMIAAGLYGIEQRLPLPPAYDGNAYLARDVPRVPGSLQEAITAWEGSAAARQAFGAEVVEHYRLTAQHEVAAFERAVTDWELARYFERI